MRDSITGQSRGFAFVTMAKSDSKEAIYNEGVQHRLSGRKLNIKPYNSLAAQNDAAMMPRKVFVGGISPSVGEEALEKYFSTKFGDLEQVHLMRYPDGRSRGFAFAVFKTSSTASKVLAKRLHLLTDTETIEVKPCLARAKLRTDRLFKQVAEQQKYLWMLQQQYCPPTLLDPQWASYYQIIKQQQPPPPFKQPLRNLHRLSKRAAPY